MGNNESRLSAPEIRKCVDSIEDELLTGGYEAGVTPESAVMTLRTLCMAVEKGGGNVVVPKAMGVRYDRDVVVSCFPKAKSRYSASTVASSKGYSRRKVYQAGPDYDGAVEIPAAQSYAMSASEARKIRMQQRAGGASSTSRRRSSGASAPRRSVASDDGHPPDRAPAPTAEEAIEDTMNTLEGLNIRRAPQDHGRNDEPVFRGPPAMRGITGNIRDRARALEGRN